MAKKKGKRWVILASSRCPETKKLIHHHSLHMSKEEADLQVEKIKSEFDLVYCDIILATEAPFLKDAKKKRVILWKNNEK